MLTQSALPSLSKAVLSSASDHSKSDLLYNWIPSSETCQKCPKCDELPWDCCRESISTSKEKDIAADCQSLIYSRTRSKSSTARNMCANSASILVYKRRKLQRNSVAFVSAQATNGTEGSVDCVSNMRSEALSLEDENDDPLVSKIKNEIDNVRAPVMAAGVCNTNLCSGNSLICGQLYTHKLDGVPCTKINKITGMEVVSKSINGFSGGEELVFDETPNNSIYKLALEYHSANDSCSSSESDVELGSASMKADTDDTGECSSSAILSTVQSGENISEKELCISILRSHGLLEGVFPIRSCTIDVLGINVGSNHSQPCKICGHFENPLNMLICDNCEESFHVSCCKPRVRKIPVDEWYCKPCARKKNKLPLEMNGKSFNVKSEVPTYRNGTTKRESSPISFMLKNTEPYTTGVRIGKAFQAEVPDWSGPIANDFDFFGEPLEMDPTKCCRLYGRETNNSSTYKSIGNWLQCREVLDDNTGIGSNGTICGKWRRAPLFEVQTDNWDCSCSVLWDPIHSDCAVPQELGTDPVLMHLKYIELLRPRLSTKIRKLSLSRSGTKGTTSLTRRYGDDP